MKVCHSDPRDDCEDESIKTKENTLQREIRKKAGDKAVSRRLPIYDSDESSDNLEGSDDEGDPNDDDDEIFFWEE
jgi:hypothetical protein